MNKSENNIALPQKEIPLKELRDFILNIQNVKAHQLAKEFDFNKYDEDYIFRTCRPIITLTDVCLNEIKEHLIKLKNEFINTYKVFDIDIFKGNNFAYLEFYINDYLKQISNGKFRLWDNVKEKYFFKTIAVGDDENHQTLIITDKNEIELTIYFKQILNLINNFYFTNKINHNPTNTENKQLRIKGLKELVFKNGNNAINISKEFEFNKEQEFYILNKFWPIFKLNNVTLDEIKEQLLKLKKDFIDYAGVFDIDIFKRDIDLGSFEYEINEYLNSLKKRDANLWQTVKGKHFITFSFNKDPDEWLIITDKNYIQLELYFEGILSLLDNFYNENQPIKEIIHLASKEKAQQEKKLTKEQIFEEQNNLISIVSIKYVYNYFKILTEVTNKNGVFYLTEEKLLLFIKSTFIDLKPIHIDFNIPFRKDKKSVRSVFKKFEIECSKFENNNKNLKDKYTKIMMQTFNVFNENDRKKFHETDNKIPTIKIERVNKSI